MQDNNSWLYVSRLLEGNMKVMLMIIVAMTCSFHGSAAAEEMRNPHASHQHRHMDHANVKNPVASTALSISEGRKLFEKNCMVCHGKAGKGGLGPNLTGPTRMHGNTEGETFYIITDGVPGTAMRSFRSELSDTMRWHVVNYLTSIKKKKQTGSAE